MVILVGKLIRLLIRDVSYNYGGGGRGVYTRENDIIGSNCLDN